MQSTVFTSSSFCGKTAGLEGNQHKVCNCLWFSSSRSWTYVCACEHLMSANLVTYSHHLWPRSWLHQACHPLPPSHPSLRRLRRRSGQLKKLPVVHHLLWLTTTAVSLCVIATPGQLSWGTGLLSMALASQGEVITASHLLGLSFQNYS